MSRETRSVPQEILSAGSKAEVIDLAAQQEQRRTKRELQSTSRKKSSAAEVDKETQRQVESLTQKLRFLLKRLDIVKDTLSDPDAVKQIDKHYKDLINEMQKSVVKYDSKIKPLRADIKKSGNALDAMQKKYDESSGAAKFIRTIFPALDSAGRELAQMRAGIEEKKKDLEARQEKRIQAASGAKEYNDLINALHQAEGIVAELNTLKAA
ncbi:hypothetical protein HY622_02245 [Candidatus Uhrbacteria bacterium]|nr:hypothetical protein [Candidatus Uhrbacteria bacterium]